MDAIEKLTALYEKERAYYKEMHDRLNTVVYKLHDEENTTVAEAKRLKTEREMLSMELTYQTRYLAGIEAAIKELEA